MKIIIFFSTVVNIAVFHRKLTEKYNKICKQFTFATVRVSISRVTSFVTLTSLFVTCGVVQTVTTTAVDTVIAIGTANTLCNRYT